MAGRLPIKREAAALGIFSVIMRPIKPRNACIAPSISSSIPGKPLGKPAGVRCVQLDQDNRCRIFGRPERPAVCGSLRAAPDMCGSNRAHAMQYLMHLEQLTSA
jgi:uncharacterized protein